MNCLIIFIILFMIMMYSIKYEDNLEQFNTNIIDELNNVVCKSDNINITSVDVPSIPFDNVGYVNVGKEIKKSNDLSNNGNLCLTYDKFLYDGIWKRDCFYNKNYKKCNWKIVNNVPKGKYCTTIVNEKPRNPDLDVPDRNFPCWEKSKIICDPADFWNISTI